MRCKGLVGAGRCRALPQEGSYTEQVKPKAHLHLMRCYRRNAVLVTYTIAHTAAEMQTPVLQGAHGVKVAAGGRGDIWRVPAGASTLLCGAATRHTNTASGFNPRRMPFNSDSALTGRTIAPLSPLTVLHHGNRASLQDALVFCRLPRVACLRVGSASIERRRSAPEGQGHWGWPQQTRGSTRLWLHHRL